MRILALGVRNIPKTSFSVNDNAWLLFHPPNVRLPNEIEEIPTGEPDMTEGEDEDTVRSVPGLCLKGPSISNLQDTDLERRHSDSDPTAPRRLRYPTPASRHHHYPMYTPGGFDRRWVDGFELGLSDVKWVGNMMYDILFLQGVARVDVLSGWLLSLSDRTLRWNLGLDHPNYKIRTSWSDQVGTSMGRCAGKI